MRQLLFLTAAEHSQSQRWNRSQDFTLQCYRLTSLGAQLLMRTNGRATFVFMDDILSTLMDASVN